MIDTYYADWCDEQIYRASDGDLVKLEDHLEVIKELQLRLETLKKENASLKQDAMAMLRTLHVASNQLWNVGLHSGAQSIDNILSGVDITTRL